MALQCRYLYYILLIICPVPVILLGIAANAVNQRVVASTPLGTILVDASKIVLHAF
jgi:hypothetical protein